MDSIDYREAKFKFLGIRKHFFKDITYHITVFDEIVVMGIVKIINLNLDSWLPESQIHNSTETWYKN